MLLELLLACASPRSDHTVTYRLEWDTSGVTPTESGWSVVHDGAEIHVSSAYLTTARTQLGTCYVALRGWGSVAWAGHAGDLGPTAVFEATVEPLGPAPGWDFGARELDQAYCAAEWVVGHADPETVSPADVAMEGLTLSMDVRVVLASGGERDLHLESNETWRRFAGFEDGGALDAGLSSGTVVFVRPLARLFEGVDVEQVTEDELAAAILSRLVAHTRVTLEVP